MERPKLSIIIPQASLQLSSACWQKPSLFSDSGTDDAKNILLAVELVPRLLPLIV